MTEETHIEETEVQQLFAQKSEHLNKSYRRTKWVLGLVFIAGTSWLVFSATSVIRLEKRSSYLQIQTTGLRKDLQTRGTELDKSQTALTNANETIRVKDEALRSAQINLVKGRTQEALRIVSNAIGTNPTPQASAGPDVKSQKVISSEAVKETDKVFSSDEVDQKARVLRKIQPGYTEDARKNSISGTVRLKAVLRASGNVTDIIVESGPEHGLREKAIEAARLIKFTPAKKDGKAVSTYATLEYTFTLY